MNDALPNGLRPNGHPESPTTPVNNVLSASDMKIDMDLQEQESDVRHDPRPKHASLAPDPVLPGPCPLVNYPVLLLTSWLASIAIDPPHGTPPPGEEDAKMAEDSPSNTQHLDVQMADVGLNGRLSEKRSREPTPVAASFSTVVDASTSYTTPNEYSTQEDEGSVPPPAKRARTFSDPDQASIMHVSGSYLCTPLLAC
jgi:bromodomain-containing factor 1